MRKGLFLLVTFSIVLCLFASCDKEEDKTKVDPPIEEHTHIWGNWEEQSATCTVSGKRERKCTSCDEIETEDIPALGHDFKNGYCTRCDIVDPTNLEMIDGKEFKSIALSKEGVLSFSRLKCASKYTLTLTYSGLAQKEVIELKKTQGTYSLTNLPIGRTMATLTAYEKVEIKIENETQYQEIPISTATDEFRITKINDTYTLERLKYKDRYLTLNGFYDTELEDATTKEKYLLYECVLKDNQSMAFKIKNQMVLAEGYSAVFYKTAEARKNEDTSQAWDSTNLTMGYPQIHHGNNMYYVRIVNAEGDTKDYNLNVYGLYTVEIERYAVELETDSEGYRTYKKEKLGNTLTIVEKDILPSAVLYENVAEGKLGRDNRYNILEKKDNVLTISDSVHPDNNHKVKVPIYFYNEEEVRSDFEEYKACYKNFEIVENDFGITLSTSGSRITGEVTIPSILVGKRILSVSFFSSDATVIYVAEGATTFVVQFGYCNKITDIYLPSTILSMNEFAFGSNSLDVLPSTMTIHCAFSQAYANQFPYKWNSIAGTTKKFPTVYGEAAPIQIDGIQYVINSNELTVTGVTEAFTGVIPDSVKVNGRIYPVTKIEHIENVDTLKIGKNIRTIVEGAFTGAIEDIEIHSENSNFLLEDGLVYTATKDRIVVATKGLNKLFIPSTVETIDVNAFTNCTNLLIYTEQKQIPETWMNCDFSGVSFIYDFKEIFQNESFEYIITNSNTACLISYHGNDTEVRIEENIEGAKLIEIATRAFQNCKSLEKVILPNSLEVLGDAIFEGCSNLKYISLPFVGKDLKTPVMLSNIIGIDVCDVLQSITVTQATALADQAFAHCIRLNEISLPDTLMDIGRNLFEDCEALHYNELNNVRYLGNREHPYLLLADTRNQNISEVVIAEECNIICADAFTNCVHLLEATVPLRLLDQFPLKTIHSLTISSGTSLMKATIEPYQQLESIHIPSTIQEIEEGVFDFCTNLIDLYVSPENQVYSSAKGVLYNYDKTEVIAVLPSLRTIEIINSVTYLKRGILKGNQNVTELILPFAFGGEENRDNDSGYLGYLFSAREEYGSFYANKNVPTTLKKVVITGGTKVVSRAFWTCDMISEIALPNTLESIGTWALACNGLKMVTVPFIRATLFDGSISEQFRDYFQSVTIDDVKSYYIPKGLTTVSITSNTISARAFQDCTAIRQIFIPDSIETICSFEDCNLQYNEYENGYYLGNEENPYVALVSIKDKNVNEFIIHEQTKIIGRKAFENTTLSTITIPSQVRTICAGAFSHSSLQKIEIPGNVKTIENQAFVYCDDLKTIIIQEGVESIGEQVFYENELLETVLLPKSLQRIESYNFVNSSWVKYNIYYMGTNTEWNKMDISDLSFGSTTLYCYSKTEPSDVGNYWHYVNDIPTVW